MFVSPTQQHPAGERVTVCILVNQAYQVTEFQGEERIVSPTFQTLTLTAAQILDAEM